jgi:AraC-like DNA-binding protein
LLPAVFYGVYILLTFQSWQTAQQVDYILESRELLAPSLPHAIEAFREALFVFFGVLCLVEIRHAQEQIHHRYSNLIKIDFVWLGTLVAVFMFLRSWRLLVVGIAFIKPDLGPETFNAMGLIGNYVMFAMISMLIFFSLTRASVFVGKISKQDTLSSPEDVEIDPQIAEKIKRHMEFHKPYLSHYLNLEQLATQLSMHPRALSSAIKHSFNTNFYEFINSYRIDEAKKLLLDPEQPNRTMIDILGEAGFNSKATFNAFFKKLVGTTPSQYRASHNSTDV